MKKKYVSFICLIILCLLFIGCKKDEVPVDENGNYVAPILEGEHTIFEKDLDIYLLVQGKPEYQFGTEKIDLKYAITIYSDFKKENRTSRHYSYYQVDYITKDSKLNQYYHFFEFVTDGTERSYAQRFLPYNKLSDLLDLIKVKFEYSFMIDEVVYEEECVFEEDILEFNISDNYLDNVNDYNVSINKTVDEDNNNRYKLSLEIIEAKEGHLDFTAFVKFTDGNIYPLYGLYHYNFARGSYASVSDTIVSGKLEIEEVYYAFKECLSDGTINYKYYKN